MLDVLREGSLLLGQLDCNENVENIIYQVLESTCGLFILLFIITFIPMADWFV